MLVKCPECRKAVSSMANACPHCGYPISKDTNTSFEVYPHENAVVREAMNNSMNAKSNNSTPTSTKTPNSSKGTVWAGIAACVGLAYLAYSIYYWMGVNSSVATPAPNIAQDSMEAIGMQIGAGVATAMVFPHLICTGLALLFDILAVFIKKRAFALTAGILYAVAMILFPMYFMFVVLEAIFCFVAFATMKQ